MHVVSDYKCFIHGEAHSVEVPANGFLNWKAGEYIQVAMPGVSADDREILMTGTCAEAWNAMMPEEDED